MSNQKFFFNIAWPVIAELHYHLPLRLDYQKINQLISRNYFFFCMLLGKREKPQLFFNL